MICELEFMYGINYTKTFAFNQLAWYEALDVYEQHSLRILGVIQIPNLAYATVFATTLQTTLQTTIAHHGAMPNNLDLVLISIYLSPQLIPTITNILPTIDAPTFGDPTRDFLSS
jgi:hypothetical protein